LKSRVFLKENLSLDVVIVRVLICSKSYFCISSNLGPILQKHYASKGTLTTDSMYSKRHFVFSEILHTLYVT
jgi:hypothetical protein